MLRQRYIVFTNRHVSPGQQSVKSLEQIGASNPNAPLCIPLTPSHETDRFYCLVEPRNL